MTDIKPKIELARQFFEAKEWICLNNLIDYSDAFNNIHDQLLFYKVMAMANLEEHRTSDALIALLKEHLNHPQDGGLYTRVLIDMLMYREDYDEAIKYLLAVLKQYPATYEAYAQLSQCAAGKEDHGLFDWASTRHHYYLAKAHLEHFNISEAAEGFQKALEFTNFIEDTHWYAAKTQAMLGEHERALSHFEHIKALPNLEKDLQLLRLNMLRRSQDIPAAHAVATELLSQEATNIEALRAIAFCKENEGDLLGSIQQYHQILKHYPYDVMANLKAIQLSHIIIEQQQEGFTPHTDSQKLSIAMLMAEVGCDEASINMLQSIHSNTREYRDVLFLVIDRMITESDYRKAARHLEVYLAKYPRDDEALVLYANCHVYLEEWDKAIQIGEHALRIAPDNIAAEYQIAMAKYYLWCNGKQFTDDELEALADRFIDYGEYAENDSDCYFFAAQVFYGLGNIDDMETFLGLAKDRGYIGGRASFLYGVYYQAINALDKAIEEYTQSIQLYSPSINYYPHYSRAKLALDMENFDLAEQDVEILLTNWPEDPDALELMALIQKERNIVENGSTEDKFLLKMKKSGLEV